MELQLLDRRTYLIYLELKQLAPDTERELVLSSFFFSHLKLIGSLDFSMGKWVLDHALCA